MEVRSIDSTEVSTRISRHEPVLGTLAYHGLVSQSTQREVDLNNQALS